MTKIGILYVCTGRYAMFWENFFLSTEKNFLTDCSVEYFVFTDQVLNTINDRVHIVEYDQQNWPYDTLLRFHLFSGISTHLKAFDFLFFFNANMLVVKEITSAILPVKEDFIGVVHPGFFNQARAAFTYESRRESLAGMGPDEGEYYFTGALNGGKAGAFLHMSCILANRIEEDMKNGIIAVWHDESHLNRYFWENRTAIKVLDCSYGYAEGWQLPFDKKIVIQDKNKFGGHKFLREKLAP